MTTTQTVLDQLTGKAIVEALTDVMAESFEDFAEARNRYQQAVAGLRDQLGTDSSPSVQEVVEAIQRQTVSNLLYSGYLGIKANLDHFLDPVARNFLDVDFEVFLREETARRLPEYESALKIREQFFSILSPAQKALYEDISTYVCHLETVGPKLAHYYGYLLGNDLLHWIVPGYHPALVLTIRYRGMLEEYFGKKLAGMLQSFDSKTGKMP